MIFGVSPFAARRPPTTTCGPRRTARRSRAASGARGPGATRPRAGSTPRRTGRGSRTAPPRPRPAFGIAAYAPTIAMGPGRSSRSWACRPVAEPLDPPVGRACPRGTRRGSSRPGSAPSPSRWRARRRRARSGIPLRRRERRAPPDVEEVVLRRGRRRLVAPRLRQRREDRRRVQVAQWLLMNITGARSLSRWSSPNTCGAVSFHDRLHGADEDRVPRRAAGRSAGPVRRERPALGGRRDARPSAASAAGPSASPRRRPGARRRARFPAISARPR